MYIDCDKLYIGVVGVDSTGREWKFCGMQKRLPTAEESALWHGSPPEYYPEYTWTSPTGYDDADERVITHANGFFYGAGLNRIVSIK